MGPPSEAAQKSQMRTPHPTRRIVIRSPKTWGCGTPSKWPFHGLYIRIYIYIHMGVTNHLQVLGTNRLKPKQSLKMGSGMLGISMPVTFT